jgi:Repeat of unknown function (DUF5907)
MAIGSILTLAPFSATPSPPPTGFFELYIQGTTVYLQDSLGNVYAFGSTTAISSLTGDVTATGPGAAEATVVAIQGSAVSSTPPTDAQLFIWNSGTMKWTPVSMSGDVSIANTGLTSIASATVTSKLLTGYTIGPNTPLLASDSVLMAFEKLQAQVSAVSGSGITALTGDVTATGPGSAMATVVALQGHAISSTAPTNAQLLVWNSGSAQYNPVSISGDASMSNAGVLTLSSTAVTGKLLTGYTTGTNTPITATNTILQAFENLQAQIAAETGSAITALTGDGTAVGPGSAVFTLATVNSNVGSFGNQTTVAAFTVNAKGLITAASNITIGNLTNSNLSGSAGITGSNIASATITGSNVATSTISNNNLAQMAANTVKANATGVPANPVDTALGTVTEATSSVLTLVGWADATIGSPTIQVTKATTSTSGYLSFTDWNTFNSKQTSGNYITSLTGDVTATGPGSAVATVAAIQGNVISGTTGTGEVVFNDAPTFAGNVNMGGFQINSLANPTSNQDAVTKIYADTIAQGIYPQNPIIIANLINDSLNTPPVSPINFTTTYLIGPSPTGAWASIGAGHFVYYDGTTWHDALGRAVQVGDRLGIDFSGFGTLGGNMIGEQYNIATVTNATPGSYAYTFVVPANRWLVLDNNPLSYDAGNTYYFNGTFWTMVAIGFVSNAGIGLSVNGTTWNVNYDNSTIGINGSNQLYVLSAGITNTQIANDTITYAKLQNESALTLLGNPSGTLQNPEEITLGATLAFVGTALETSALTGDITTAANSFATTISANAVTYAKFQQIAASSLVGNPTASTATVEGITLGSTLTFVGSVLETNALTGDVTTSANSFATTLATVNSNIGTFGSSTAIPSLTVNAKGLITAVTTDAVVAPAGTLTGTTLAANVVSSSLTSVGTITSGVWNGTAITVPYGGTGSVSYTAGSIIFSNGTALAQDNSNFYWNDTNYCLGIGTIPSTAVMIDGVNTTGASKLVQMTGYGVGSTTGYRGRFARGTLGTPAAVQAGDNLSAISGRGYGATQFAAASTGVINIVAGETFTNTSNMTYLSFSATPTGSVTSSEHMRITATGVNLGPFTGTASTDIHSINGGMIRTNKTIVANYSVDTTTTDDIIYSNQSAALTITLPSPTSGRTIVIKDISGLAQTYGLTIAPHASEKIEGLAASKILYTNFGSWTFSSDGNNWWMI